jgi:hypothetical protein
VNHTVLSASSVAFDFAGDALFLAATALCEGVAFLMTVLLTAPLGATLLAACTAVLAWTPVLAARLGVALLTVRVGLITFPPA